MRSLSTTYSDIPSGLEHTFWDHHVAADGTLCVYSRVIGRYAKLLRDGPIAVKEVKGVIVYVLVHEERREEVQSLVVPQLGWNRSCYTNTYISKTAHELRHLTEVP